MTAAAEPLHALLARVEDAGGPDREIDALLWCMENDREPVWRDAMLLARSRVPPFDEAYIGCEWSGGFKDVGRFANPTASLDAAVALVERILPDAVWHVMTDYGDLRRAKIGPVGRPSASVYNCEERPLFEQADAVTPALALCAALLRAKIAQAEDAATPACQTSGAAHE